MSIVQKWIDRWTKRAEKLNLDFETVIRRIEKLTEERDEARMLHSALIETCAKNHTYMEDHIAAVRRIKARVDSAFNTMNQYAKDPHNMGAPANTLARILPTDIICEVYMTLAPVSQELQAMLSDDVEPEMVPCPYCGRPVEEDKIERPADYCHHD